MVRSVVRIHPELSRALHGRLDEAQARGAKPVPAGLTTRLPVTTSAGLDVHHVRGRGRRRAPAWAPVVSGRTGRLGLVAALVARTTLAGTAGRAVVLRAGALAALAATVPWTLVLAGPGDRH